MPCLSPDCARGGETFLRGRIGEKRAEVFGKGAEVGVYQIQDPAKGALLKGVVK